MDYTYPADYSVVLKAIPAPGYRLVNWSGDASGSDETIELTMSCSKSVTAVFSMATYTLMVQVDQYAGGKVTVEPQPGTGEGYAMGTQVTLNANATEGYRFSHWSGDISSRDNPVTLVMNSAREVSAHFVETSTFAWWWIAPGAGVVIIALPIYFLTTRRQGSSRK
jgi:hypothetical protein